MAAGRGAVYRVNSPPASVAILMVDDNATKRFALKAVLAPLGYTIVEASSGVEALRCLMVQDFAIILLDVMMPGMNGFETAARIRERKQSEMTPIIFITAFSEDDIAQTDHYAQGAVDFIFAPVPPTVLRAKVSVFANLFLQAQELADKARAVQASVEELGEQNVELAAIARRDPLTALRNRRALSEDLEDLEARASRYGHRYCMAVLDIDYFKSYNDTYGHPAGDEVLQIVSARLTELLRSGDSLYRYGGEEFLCIFPEQSLASGARAVERMRVGVEELAVPHIGNPSGRLTLSGGVAILDAGRRRSASQVLKEADEAMYRAKKGGRNRVETADLESAERDAVATTKNGTVPATNGSAPDPSPAIT
jgi:two-component system, cell cycle response regulator